MPDASANAATKPVLIAAEPQLFVGDIGRSIDFFTKTLGFQLQFAYGEPAFYAQVGRDGVRLNLRHVDGAVFDAGLREREEDALSASITVSDASALYAEFSAADAPFHQRLRREAWGSETFIIRDPDGNLLAFAG